MNKIKTKKIFENYFKQNLKEQDKDDYELKYDDGMLNYYKRMGMSPEEIEMVMTEPGENEFGRSTDQEMYDLKYVVRPDLMDDEEKKIVRKIVPGDAIYNKLKSSIDKNTVKQAKAKRMDLYIVLYGKMGGNPELDFKRPVLLEIYAADSFYSFLKDWPQALESITLSTQTRHASIDLTVKGEKGATTRSKGSQHRHGTAIDIRIPHKIRTPQYREYVEAIFEIAYTKGFRAFGFGPGVVHIDVRDRYTWWRYPETKPDLTFKLETAGAWTMDLLPHDAVGFDKFLSQCGIGPGTRARRNYKKQLNKWKKVQNQGEKARVATVPGDVQENKTPRVNSIFKKYFKLNESLVEKTVNTDQFTKVIDIDNLPDDKKRLAYGKIAKAAEEEESEFPSEWLGNYLSMLLAPDADLSGDEVDFMLKNVDVVAERGGIKS